MALTNPQYDAIMRMYNERQLRHQREQQEHIRIAYEKIPRLAEIDAEIASLSVRKAKAMLNGDASMDLDLNAAIRDRSQERAALLSMHGYPADYLELTYDCPLCRDTGYINGTQKCACFKKAAVDLLYRQSNVEELLKAENFSQFSLDYYSDSLTSTGTPLTSREAAAAALEKSQAFVRNFGSSFENLFFYGDTGVAVKEEIFKRRAEIADERLAFFERGSSGLAGSERCSGTGQAVRVVIQRELAEIFGFQKLLHVGLPVQKIDGSFFEAGAFLRAVDVAGVAAERAVIRQLEIVCRVAVHGKERRAFLGTVTDGSIQVEIHGSVSVQHRFCFPDREGCNLGVDFRKARNLFISNADVLLLFSLVAELPFVVHAHNRIVLRVCQCHSCFVLRALFQKLFF